MRFVHHVVKKGDFQEKLPVASIDFESTVCGEKNYLCTTDGAKHLARRQKQNSWHLQQVSMRYMNLKTTYKISDFRFICAANPHFL